MDAILWLAAVVVLLVIEIATLGLTTIWFAGGALIAGIAAVAGAGRVVQFVLFLIVSLILLIFTRPIAMRYLNTNRTRTNAESLIWQGGGGNTDDRKSEEPGAGYRRWYRMDSTDR